MFYAITYALMSAGAFGMIMLLSQPVSSPSRSTTSRGCNQRHPWMAFLMLLMMASLAGFPPLVGFFAKLQVLQALMRCRLLWLAWLPWSCAVIGAFYYLRVIKVMYFDEPVGKAPLLADSDVAFPPGVVGAMCWP